MQPKLIDVWINCPDEACAHLIAEACIDERLAACANVLAPIASVFHMNRVLERAREVPVLLKTRADLFDQICLRVRDIHPYVIPAITAMELTQVDSSFAEWIITETAEV